MKGNGEMQMFRPSEERAGTLRLMGSRDGRDGSLTIHQDVDLYGSLLGTGEISVAAADDAELLLSDLAA